MFTGLIEAIGEVIAARQMPDRNGMQLRIACPFAASLGPGESVAVSGPCLTVEEQDLTSFLVTAVPLTLERTTLGTLRPGDRVNLERALPAHGRLGGHFVQGHIDGTARLVDRSLTAGLLLEIEVAPDLLRYITPRGSIAVDGVSLTVARLDGPRFTVAIIPETQAHTTLGMRQVGDAVNVETDILAKYVERVFRREAEEA